MEAESEVDEDTVEAEVAMDIVLDEVDVLVVMVAAITNVFNNITKRKLKTMHTILITMEIIIVFLKTMIIIITITTRILILIHYVMI